MLNSTQESKKGKLTLSISQALLDRLEPYKGQVNLSAHAEEALVHLAAALENQAWLSRNHEALERYGKTIAATGLAGEEFERI